MKKIIDLPPVGTPATTDLFEVSKGGTGSFKETGAQILAPVLTANQVNFQAASVSFNSDGSVSIGTKYKFFNDGSGFQTSQPINVNGVHILDVAGSASFNNGQVVINENGALLWGAGVSQLGNDGGIVINGGDSVQVNGLVGLTTDLSVLVSGVPKTLHFENGILTSVA